MSKTSFTQPRLLFSTSGDAHLDRDLNLKRRRLLPSVLRRLSRHLARPQLRHGRTAARGRVCVTNESSVGAMGVWELWDSVQKRKQ